eukprot:5603379-Prymnesium_polylepis.1
MERCVSVTVRIQTAGRLQAALAAGCAGRTLVLRTPGVRGPPLGFVHLACFVACAPRGRFHT